MNGGRLAAMIKLIPLPLSSIPKKSRRQDSVECTPWSFELIQSAWQLVNFENGDSQDITKHSADSNPGAKTSNQKCLQMTDNLTPCAVHQLGARQNPNAFLGTFLFSLTPLMIQDIFLFIVHYASCSLCNMHKMRKMHKMQMVGSNCSLWQLKRCKGLTSNYPGVFFQMHGHVPLQNTSRYNLTDYPQVKSQIRKRSTIDRNSNHPNIHQPFFLWESQLHLWKSRSIEATKGRTIKSQTSVESCSLLIYREFVFIPFKSSGTHRQPSKVGI